MEFIDISTNTLYYIICFKLIKNYIHKHSNISFFYIFLNLSELLKILAYYKVVL